MTSQDRPDPAIQALPDKLAHRALHDRRLRGSSTRLSAQALDRLYARMFPSALCLQETNGPLPAPVPKS